jgi:hypothetical protein
MWLNLELHGARAAVARSRCQLSCAARRVGQLVVAAPRVRRGSRSHVKHIMTPSVWLRWRRLHCVRLYCSRRNPPERVQARDKRRHASECQSASKSCLKSRYHLAPIHSHSLTRSPLIRGIPLDVVSQIGADEAFAEVLATLLPTNAGQKRLLGYSELKHVYGSVQPRQLELLLASSASGAGHVRTPSGGAAAGKPGTWRAHTFER